MVGLDVTRQVVFTAQELNRLTQTGAPQARWIHDALRFYIEFHKQYEQLDGCVVNDILPIAELIDPRVLAFEEQRLVVDLEDGEHRGHTRVDAGGARVRVATRVDMARVRPLLSDRVFRWAARASAAAIAPSPTTPSASSEARA
jgi:inosine-uridine nucleoside N-ribohydrolase